MVYINGCASLSPQNSLEYSEFMKGMLEYEEAYLQSLKPDYKDLLKPIEARRMSKTVRNGIICSHIAMKQAGIDMPDAIIVGTGLGIVTDTERFLESMLDNNEQYLTPTSFIQSTHNTVAAQIALRLACHNYNFTYVNRGFSFESALLDGMMHLKEGKKHVLIGGADEMSEHYFSVTKKTGWWKTEVLSNSKLLEAESEGALCGEGVSFFVLSSEKGSETFAEVTGLKMIYKPKGIDEITEELQRFLTENGLSPNEIDLLITGNNGDYSGDALYYEFLNKSFPEKPAAYFKHLTGEYHTANSFALWMASNILKHQTYPDFIQLNQKKTNKIDKILIYNHYFNINHSFILLSRS